MSQTVPALILAGTHSGAGKTTVTLAVLAALVRRGVRVQGFKVGPDFIDPAHHTALTGRPSRNLDTWLLEPAALAATYHRATAGADLAVIEGVMGLFDGRSALDEAGSTADLARRWGLPVVLVVDARGLARSIAPLVQGFASFEPDVHVAGVVANRVGSEAHYTRYLQPALQQLKCITPLGYLVRDERMRMPERHLGLVSAAELPDRVQLWSALADAAEATVDLDRLLALAEIPALPNAAVGLPAESRPHTRVAVARDEAFCFYYEDNLDALHDAGAELVPFSPLADAEIPEGASLVYLGGGYPELHAERLAANTAMRRAIAAYHAAGGSILAECGGMMACCRELCDAAGRAWPMWDLIPARVVMKPRFQALGYVSIVAEQESLLGPAGTVIRGHEFHYSVLEALEPVNYATRLERPEAPARPDGMRVGGLLAGYAHMHFGSNPDVARSLVLAAGAQKRGS